MVIAGPEVVASAHNKHKAIPHAPRSNSKEGRDHSRRKAAKDNVREIAAAATTVVVVDVVATGAVIVHREAAHPQLLRRLEIELALGRCDAAPRHGLHGQCDLSK